jgi:hypothetical protein
MKIDQMIPFSQDDHLLPGQHGVCNALVVMWLKYEDRLFLIVDDMMETAKAYHREGVTPQSAGHLLELKFIQTELFQLVSADQNGKLDSIRT